jgi:hypothetical protein
MNVLAPTDKIINAKIIAVRNRSGDDRRRTSGNFAGPRRQRGHPELIVT